MSEFEDLLFGLFSDDEEQVSEGGSTIEETNVTSGLYTGMVTAPDGRTFFYGNGIKYLNGEGEIVSTVAMTGNYRGHAFNTNGDLFIFGSGVIVLIQIEDPLYINMVSGILTGDFYGGGVGADGRFYACGSSGIWELAPDADVGYIAVNVETGQYTGVATHDGELYFYGQGVKFVDGDGTITPLDGMASHTVNYAGEAHDGTFYFLTENGTAVMNGDGTVSFTAETGEYEGMTVVGEKTYFYGASGIIVLDGDGVFTAVTATEHIRSAAVGQDGILYFGGNGIFVLDDNGTIVQTDITDGIFYGMGTGSDGQLYFPSSAGIMVLHYTPSPEPPKPTEPPAPVVFDYGTGGDSDLLGKDANDIRTKYFLEPCRPPKGYINLVFDTGKIFGRASRYTHKKSQIVDFQMQNQGAHLVNLIALTEDEYEFFEDFLIAAANGIRNIIGAYGRHTGVRSMEFKRGTPQTPGAVIYAIAVPPEGFIHNYVLQLFGNIRLALYYSVLLQWAQWCNDSGEIAANTVKYGDAVAAVRSFANVGCMRNRRPIRRY